MTGNRANAASVQSARAEASEVIESTLAQINSVVLGKEDRVKLAVTCLLAGGHLLIEDLPGTGKTVLAHALAKTFGLDFQRLQFTNDLLPADIVGASIFDRNTNQFHFHQGPVFTQILLADEINRASPKAQSGLLEVMEERQVSVDGKTYALPVPFFVVATQNPLEQSGTARLPDSQLDRFMMCIDMGYPGREPELEILASADKRTTIAALSATLSAESLVTLQRQAAEITASPALLSYLRDLLEVTRQNDDYLIGLSTRAGLALLQAARAWALLEQETQVLPSHIQAVLPYVAGHRLAGNRNAGRRLEVGHQVLNAVPVF
ncbi:MAG: AAA family ATPase [Pseudomonadota bacterium]